MEPSADATALAAASEAEAEAGGADMRPGPDEVPVLDPKVGDMTPSADLSCSDVWGNGITLQGNSSRNSFI